MLSGDLSLPGGLKAKTISLMEPSPSQWVDNDLSKGYKAMGGREPTISSGPDIEEMGKMDSAHILFQ